MHLDQDNPTHRALVAAVVAALITFAGWGVWMSVAAIVGAIGWVADTIGGWLLATSTKMTNVHTTIAWIAFACGAVAGTILGLGVRVDRLWDRLAPKKTPVEEHPSGA